MNLTKRWLSILLCVMMAFTVFTVVAGAAGGETNVTFEVEKTEVKVDDTFTVTLSNKAMTVMGFTAGFTFDNTLLECVSIVGPRGTARPDYYYLVDTEWGDKYVATAVSTVDQANENGTVGFAYIGTADTAYEAGLLFTVTFKAKAAGTANFTLYEETNGTDAFTSDGIETKTLTINSNCEHTNKTAIQIEGENNHKIVCGDCGTTVTESEPCSGGEATCGARAVCEVCETPYGEKKSEHGEVHPVRYVNNGNGTHDQYNYCIMCGTQLDLVGDDLPCTDDYINETNVEGSDGFCDGCGEHVCSASSYTDLGDGTHQAYCTCGEKFGEAVAHDYTTGASEHTCACGDVEKFTLSIRVLIFGENTVELTVEYGANLLDVLAQAAEEGKIPAIGYSDRIVDEFRNGEEIVSHYSYQSEGTDGWTDIDESHTMPATDFEIDQDSVFIGWWIYFDSEDNYVGTDYSGDADYIYESGWKYIEENYDDVEGGAWYYFYPGSGEWEGYVFRAEGMARVPYPEVAINGVSYAPNAEDVAYAESKGRTFIDKDEAWFVFGEDGKFDATTEIVDGKYVANGMIAWHPGFVTVNNELYYFVGDAENGGNKLANGIIWVTRGTGADTYKPGYISFVDGQVDTEFTGVGAIKGVNYYFENGVYTPGKGLVQIGDKYIYVRSAGQLAIGVYYANGVKYEFDENGYTSGVKNGLVDGKIYKDGHLVYGLVECDGDIYYVKSNGTFATGVYYITNTNGMEGFSKGDKLIFDEDGKMLEIKNGIVEENGAYYYYENNRLQCGAGVVQMTDEQGETYYIYVRSNGQLATGEYYPTTLNGYLEKGKYDWGKDGKYYPGK